MTVQEYFDTLQRDLADRTVILKQALRWRDSGTGTGFIEGHLDLAQRHQLHVAEYVLVDPVFSRRKYRFHLQNSSLELVRRWDNAPHHPNLQTFPHHSHMPDGEVVASPPMDLPRVLDAVAMLLA